MTSFIWCLRLCPHPIGSGAAAQVSPLPMVLAHVLVGMLGLATYLTERDLPETCCTAAGLGIVGLLAVPRHSHQTCSALLVWVL